VVQRFAEDKLAVHYNALECVAEFCSVVQCCVVLCSVLQCVAVCCTVCSVLHCDASLHGRQTRGVVQLRCVARVLQCAAMLKCSTEYCSVLQCFTENEPAVCCNVWQRVAACGSVLQRVAACCSVLKHVAMCCSAIFWCTASLRYVAAGRSARTATHK